MRTEQERLNRIAELELLLKASEDKIAAMSKSKGHVQMRVSNSGYVEIYGLPSKGRFSISLSPEGWEVLFAMVEDVRAFAKTNTETCKERMQAYRLSKATSEKMSNVG
jgi:hypothetical protein